MEGSMRGIFLSSKDIKLGPMKITASTTNVIHECPGSLHLSINVKT
jgi:hypothetical protein